MSFAQKSSRTKSASLEVSLKDGNGLTSSPTQPKSASLEVSLKNSSADPKNGNGLTVSASAELAPPAVSLSKNTSSTSCTYVEQSKVDSPAVSVSRKTASRTYAKQSPASFAKSDAVCSIASTEQQNAVFPASNTSDDLSTPEELLDTTFPATTLTDCNGVTSSTTPSAPQPKLAVSAISLDAGNGVGFSASTERQQATFPTPAISTTSGPTLIPSAEQPTFASSVRGKSLTSSVSSDQPKPAFLGAKVRHSEGVGLSTSTGSTVRSFVTEQGTRTRTVSGLANRPVTPTTIESRNVIQKDEWLEAARRSTEYFKAYGSQVPLVWVLTEGNRIPDNAVPFGEDRNGYTLYIARALLEGSLHIGKASVQSCGAIIGYAGRERIVANYEVLVFASQLRWGLPSAAPEHVLAECTIVNGQQRRNYGVAEDSRRVTLVDNDVLRIIRDNSFDVRVGQGEQMGWSGQATQTIQAQTQIGPAGQMASEDADSLKRLAEVKTVIVIDDSLSMHEGNLWAQAREALGGIVDIANQYGSSGADIHFMHWDDYAPNMQSKSEIGALFSRVLPEGEDTPTGAKLGRIIDHYVPLIEDEQSTHEPIVVVVITDGLPTDQAELDRVIVNVANRLDQHQVKHDMFRIQFVQIGTDPAASELLHILDDDLMNRYKIRDIVDCTPYDPTQGAFDTEYMLKILLGGLRKDLDRINPNRNERPNGVLFPSSAAMQYERTSPRGLTAKLGNTNPRPVSPRPTY